MIEVTTKEQLEALRNNSAYTITGAGGDLTVWTKGYEELLNKEEIGIPNEWYTFKGQLMNNVYNLTRDNRYPDDLTFLCFNLDGLDIDKLAIFKIKMQDRWLDDIIDNNLVREN